MSRKPSWTQKPSNPQRTYPQAAKIILDQRPPELSFMTQEF